jgi:hypothetical protein
MYDFTSRYAPCETVLFTAPNGQVIVYTRRRFLPPGESLPLLAELPLAPGDRLDLLAFRALGDPLQFWRIADANNAIDPFALEESRPEDAPPRALRVPIPQP